MSRPRRYAVMLEDMTGVIEKDAKANRRSVAAHILWVLEWYYKNRKEEVKTVAELFTPTPLHEAKHAGQEQHFQTLSQHVRDIESNAKEKRDQDRT